MTTPARPPARIISIVPRHPSQQKGESGPSWVELNIDTGLKSGALTVVNIQVRDAIQWSAQLGVATNTAYQVTEQARDHRLIPEPTRLTRVVQGRNVSWEPPEQLP